MATLAFESPERRLRIFHAEYATHATNTADVTAAPRPPVPVSDAIAIAASIHPAVIQMGAIKRPPQMGTVVDAAVEMPQRHKTISAGYRNGFM